MSRAADVASSFQPWAGLILGAIGAGFAHQTGANSVFNDCLVSSPVIVWICGLAGLFVVLAGAGLSWSVLRRQQEAPARRLVAAVSLMTACLLLFAVTLPLIAAALIPPCFG